MHMMGPVYFINWNLARGLRLFLIDLLFQLGLAIPFTLKIKKEIYVWTFANNTSILQKIVSFRED